MSTLCSCHDDAVTHQSHHLVLHLCTSRSALSAQHFCPELVHLLRVACLLLVPAEMQG